jgi:MFS family permease
MANHAITFGSALLIIAFYGYYGDTGPTAKDSEDQGSQVQEIDSSQQPAHSSRSLTALLFPGGFGLGMLLAGLLAMKTGARKQWMHVAAMLALLGAIAAWGRAVSVLMDDEKDVPLMLLLMGIVCTIFVVLSIRSFMAAREGSDPLEDSGPSEDAEPVQEAKAAETTESAEDSGPEAGEAEDDDGD